MKPAKVDKINYSFTAGHTLYYYKMRNQLNWRRSVEQSVKCKHSKLVEEKSISQYNKMIMDENLPTNFNYDQEIVMISMGSRHGGHDDNLRGRG